MIKTVWHDERGNVVMPFGPTTHDVLVSTTARMEATPEHVMTPERVAELSEDARRVLEACERYGSCGD